MEVTACYLENTFPCLCPILWDLAAEKYLLLFPDPREGGSQEGFMLQGNSHLNNDHFRPETGSSCSLVRVVCAEKTHFQMLFHKQTYFTQSL